MLIVLNQKILLNSRGDQSLSDLPVSMSVHCREHDAFLFALYQDHKLRMWSYKVSMKVCFLCVYLLLATVVYYFLKKIFIVLLIGKDKQERIIQVQHEIVEVIEVTYAKVLLSGKNII